MRIIEILKKRFVFSVFVAVGLATASPIKSDAADNTDTVDASITTNDKVAEADMISYIQDQLEKSRNVESFVRVMIESARKENDTVKILCIDDKLTQIQTLLKSIENRATTLDAALKASDSGAAQHQFVILQVSFSKLNGLRTQADTCVGNSDIIIGATESEVTVSEGITPEEATTPEQEIFTPDPVVRPSVASGYR